jgi:cytochrome c556
MAAMTPRSLAAVAVALAMAAGTAAAQVAPAISLAEQMRAVLAPAAGGGAAFSAGGLGAFDAPIVVNGPVQLRQSATELAQRFPAAHRAAMTKAYEESFVFWQKLEAQLGLTPNDVAAGVAAFIAGNYAAFMQQQVADEDFKSLVLQMQGLLARNAAFTRSSPAAKRAMFEQLAMVGTFMAVYREHLTRQPSPNEEVHFRNAAKANLEAGLGLAVERIQIGSQGLVMR